MNDQKYTDLIESSDISELEEIYLKRKKDEAPKHEEPKATSVAKQPTVVAQKVVIPANSVEVIPQVSVEQPTPVYVAPIEENIKPTITEPNTRPSMDGIINNILERKNKQIDEEAIAKKKAAEDRIYNNLIRLLEMADAPQPPPTPIVVLPTPSVPPSPIENKAEENPLPDGKVFRAKPPKQPEPKQKGGYTLKSIIGGVSLVGIAGAATTYLLHALHLF
jgi:hypothetical protein